MRDNLVRALHSLQVHRVSLSSSHRYTRPVFAPRLIRALVMAHPTHSSAHPAQDSQHAPNTFAADAKKQQKKNSKTAVISSGYPLEVWKSHLNPLDGWFQVVQLQPLPEFFDHRLNIFNELKSEYDAWVSCMVVLFGTRFFPHFLVLKPNQEKRSLLPCLMGRNEMAKVGKLVLWRLPRRFPRVCQSA